MGRFVFNFDLYVFMIKTFRQMISVHVVHGAFGRVTK